MKGVILEVSPAQLARRRLTGEDRWDELWEGVLHMSPAPALEHQRSVRFGHEPGPPARLIVEDATDPASRVLI